MYWLMKSEPDVFSIDDLEKCPNQTEPWNGVRNYQVRNWLRDEFRKGDQAFFYHSSCAIPGIAGIVEIVREAYPDLSALNPESEYYDPQSKAEKPRWFCVDVRLIRKFPRIITLQELKTIPGLETMILLKKGNRLSITPVMKKEWNIIVELSQ